MTVLCRKNICVKASFTKASQWYGINMNLFSSISHLFSHSVLSDFATPWTAACQASLSFTISWHFLKFMSIVSMMPSRRFFLCCPLLLLLSIFLSIGSFPVSWLFTSGGQSIGASASASVLSMNIQSWFPLGLTGLISLQSKGHSRVSPAPQFKSINSSVFSRCDGPTLTLGPDHWKIHSFDYTDFCGPSDVSAF